MAYPKRRRKTGRLILLVLILIFAFLAYDSNTRIEVSEYNLSYSCLPSDFDGFRIVQLSDIHTTLFGKNNEKLFDAVRKAAPDIIAITGDLVDDNTHGDYIARLFEGLTAIAPVYYVTGNHEWSSHFLSELQELMGEYGVTYLSNEYVLLERSGRSIVLAGVDDPCGYADMKTPRELIEEIHRDVGTDKYVCLLSHRNNSLTKYSGLGYDTILSGHAHGGLIRLPFTDGLIGPSRELFPDYTCGIYSENGTDMVVSRGLAVALETPRFLNNPHIPIIILHTA